METTVASVPQSVSPRFSLSARTLRLLLPHREAMALLDRVEQCSLDEQRLVGIKNVARTEPFVMGHFPEDPIFPQTLIVEALAQACGCLMNLLYVRGAGVAIETLTAEDCRGTRVRPPLSVLAESKIVQTGLVFPGDCLRLHARMTLRRREVSAFAVEATVESRSIAHGQMILAYPAYVPRQAGPGLMQER
jgi:3-hydroxyacyl-[acyl-carrier-protein] dehydratase